MENTACSICGMPLTTPGSHICHDCLMNGHQSRVKRTEDEHTEEMIEKWYDDPYADHDFLEDEMYAIQVEEA